MTAAPIDYQRLAQELLAQQTRTKAVSSTPTPNIYGHGNGGLFSAPGLSKPVFSAMMLPHLGLQSELPVKAARDFNPLYGIITGTTASTGTEPVGPCDDPPTVGLMQLCMHSFVFGRQSRQSPVIDLRRVGNWTNRGEFQDFNVVNDPMTASSQTNGMIPTIPGSDSLSGAANSEVTKQLFQLAVGWARDFARELYTGNPANNTSGGGRKYYYGLDTLINTGYKDAETAILCPAADSIVRNFGNLDIGANGSTFVRTVHNIFRNLRYIATRTNLDPVTWAITMPWSMFYEVTEVWPCAYLSYRCQVQSGNATSAFMSVDEQIKMRDEMRGNIFDRTGQYLLIDGQRVPVILDDGITELDSTTSTAPAGSFRSTMYFVPMTVLGSTPVTYLEYFDYSLPGGSETAANIFAPQGSFQVSDNGRFFWHRKPPTNFCVQLLASTEPRLIMLTPFLAARMTNIQYAPLAHERSPFTDSAYFAAGGVTDRAGRGPSYYPPQ